MKVILLLALCCLALHNGKGAPRTAVYKFVRCNPQDDQANCVTLQSPEMPWTPDLPAKLPASTAQYLEAEPVEDESPKEDDEVEEEMEEDETPAISEDKESLLFADSSGDYEGSAYEEDSFIADRASVTAESEPGSGESEKDMDLYKGEDMTDLRQSASRSLVGESKPAEEELRDDHLLQL